VTFQVSRVLLLPLQLDVADGEDFGVRLLLGGGELGDEIDRLTAAAAPEQPHPRDNQDNEDDDREGGAIGFHD